MHSDTKVDYRCSCDDFGAELVLPDRELVAMDTTLRAIAMPSQIMWSALAPHMKATAFGDNEAMLQVIKTGRSPSMRYIARTHRVSVAWLHEVYVRVRLVLATKRLSLWRRINLLSPSLTPRIG